MQLLMCVRVYVRMYVCAHVTEITSDGFVFLGLCVVVSQHWIHRPPPCVGRYRPYYTQSKKKKSYRKLPTIS